MRTPIWGWSAAARATGASDIMPIMRKPTAIATGANRRKPVRMGIVLVLPTASMGACRSRTNADDRLPRASLPRVEGGDGIAEGRDAADVRPQPSVPHPLDDLT